MTDTARERFTHMAVVMAVAAAAYLAFSVTAPKAAPHAGGPAYAGAPAAAYAKAKDQGAGVTEL